MPHAQHCAPLPKTDVSVIVYFLVFVSYLHEIILQNNLSDRIKTELHSPHVDVDSRKHSRVKKESLLNNNPSDGSGEQADLRDEPGDFIETNCHWKDCGTEFSTQEELVKVFLVCNVGCTYL